MLSVHRDVPARSIHSADGGAFRAPGTIAGTEQSRHHPGPLGAPVPVGEENEQGNSVLLLSAVEENIRRRRAGVLV